MLTHLELLLKVKDILNDTGDFYDVWMCCVLHDDSQENEKMAVEYITTRIGDLLEERITAAVEAAKEHAYDKGYDVGYSDGIAYERW